VRRSMAAPRTPSPAGRPELGTFDFLISFIAGTPRYKS
jgi:hypothetical protein